VAGSRPASVAACATTRAAVSNSASGPIVRESLAANTNDGPVRVADDTYLFEDRRVSAVGRCVSTVRYANNKAAHFLAFYDDAYARTAEGWKFTRRVVRMMSFDLTEEGA
jgi:hypothetical protein